MHKSDDAMRCTGQQDTDT
jgi:ankyrin repeat protein